jgi:hypothetical protein
MVIRFKENQAIQDQAKLLEPLVADGQLAWADAADRLIQTFLHQQ